MPDSFSRTVKVYPEGLDPAHPEDTSNFTGKWRWQKIGANQSDIVADSGQGYASPVGALQAAVKEADENDKVLIYDVEMAEFVERSAPYGPSQEFRDSPDRPEDIVE